MSAPSKQIPAGVEIDGAITKEMDRRFLSSIDLAGQGEVTLTIDRVEKHAELAFLNGRAEKNAILCYFKEIPGRPLLLRACHIKPIIVELKTNRVADWKGHKITLHAVEGTFFGKRGMAVRVAPAK